MAKWKHPWLVGLLWLALGSGIALAQERTITGRVVESGTQRAIGNAKVVVQGTDLETFTEPNGSFVLVDALLGEVHLVVSADDFNTALTPL